MVEESLAAAAVSSYHGDGPADAVGPVQVTVDPVESDALGSVDVAPDHHAVMSGVFGRVHWSSGMTTDRRRQGGVEDSDILLSFWCHSPAPVDLLLGDV